MKDFEDDVNMKTTALLLVDHGSSVPEANAVIEVLKTMIQSLRPHLQVEIAHMEISPPSIADGFNACVKNGAKNVIVHPYMLSPGKHSTRDIPEAVRQVANNHPGVSFTVTEPLGPHQKLCEIVLERAKL
jgi:sirohydrochlorin ferrochelatase